MLFAPPLRFAVNLSLREVVARIRAQTQPLDVELQGDNLFDRFRGGHREQMDRVFNQRFLSRIYQRSFEIEASGQLANQMGTLKGTLTPQGKRTIVEARYTPNRNTWITMRVVSAFLFVLVFFGLCTGHSSLGSKGGLGGLVCILSILGIPALVVSIVGILQFARARHSARVLRAFLWEMFADDVGPPESTRKRPRRRPPRR